MERFIGIRSNRTTFAGRDEFQAYWDRLDSICSKQRQKKQSNTGPSPQERRQRKNAAIAKYYRQAHHLDAYARKYYLRYRPSQKRLQEQLSKKCDQPNVVEQVLNDLGNLIDDYATGCTQRDILLGKGKNQIEICLALRRKGYQPDTISTLLMTDNDDCDDSPLIDEDALMRRIRSLLRKGKAPREIIRTVASTENERGLAEYLLAEIQRHEQQDGMNSTLAAIEKIVTKLKRQGKDQWAMRSALMRKGFDRQDIENALNPPAE